MPEGIQTLPVYNSRITLKSRRGFFSKAIRLAQTADCTLRWFKPGLAAHPTHLVDKQTPRFSVDRP